MIVDAFDAIEIEPVFDFRKLNGLEHLLEPQLGLGLREGGQLEPQ